MSSKNSAVRWREWNEESFEVARRENKPILLDIGAVWCHWCHVMDDGIPGDPVHTGTYSNPDIARTIAERYIPIKVDNDRRPDINIRYNQGGWPSTVFLTPAGKILYGETYVEPRRMAGLLNHVADYYRDNQATIVEKLEEHDVVILQTAQRDEPQVVGPDIPAKVAAAIAANFDSAYGGFGKQPKFPHPEALIFAIEQWKRTGSPELKEIVTLSLTAMAGGGMYDRYAGGFFRYSTTRDWSVPHYEKMAQDNARLSMACLLAGAAFANARFTDVALDVHQFMLTILRDPATGCFGGSQDADQEERYYGLPLADRAKLPTPFIDWTIYVDWNAMMVSSLALRYKLVDPNPEILAVAEHVYAFITASVLPHHFFADGQRGGETDMLTDLSSLIEAAAAMYEVTGRPEYLADAATFAERVLSTLTDTRGGGFYDTIPNPTAIGELAEPRVDIIQSSETALALAHLSALSGDNRFREAAVKAVGRFAKQYQHHSFMAGSYGRAAAAVLAEPVRVVIVGDAKSAQELQRAAWSVAPPHAIVDRRGATNAGEYRTGPSGAAAAYVCVGTSCRQPVMTASDLRAELQSMTEPMRQ